jgi:hypothetical protein
MMQLINVVFVIHVMQLICIGNGDVVVYESMHAMKLLHVCSSHNAVRKCDATKTSHQDLN